MKCYNCGGRAHLSRDCPSPPIERNSSNNVGNSNNRNFGYNNRGQGSSFGNSSMNNFRNNGSNPSNNNFSQVRGRGRGRGNESNRGNSSNTHNNSCFGKEAIITEIVVVKIWPNSQIQLVVYK